MFMSEGLDEGDMIYQRKTPISDSDNAETLHDRLMVLGTECILETVKDLENGEIPRIQQDSQFATYAPMIQKSDAEINWNDSDRNICNLIRGMNPHPGAWTTIQKNPMRIYEAVPGPSADAAPGTVVCADVKKGIIVACGNQGSVVLTRIQMAGGKAMNACDYLRGHQIPEGISLGRDSE